MNRALLVLLIAISISAGCTTTPNPSPTVTPSSTSGGADSATPTTSPPPDPLRNIPKPTDKCEVSSLPDATYPPLPSSVTESSAENFSHAFEKAYSSATLEGEQGVSVSGFDGSNTRVIQQTNTGFVVRAWVSLDYTMEDGNTTVAGSDEIYVFGQSVELIVVQ